MASSIQIATKIATGGRIVIPARYRKALGLRAGDEVMLSLQDGEVRLYTRDQARKRARDLVCRLIPRNVSLVDELIRERRKEAAIE